MIASKIIIRHNSDRVSKVNHSYDLSELCNDGFCDEHEPEEQEELGMLGVE